MLLFDLVACLHLQASPRLLLGSSTSNLRLHSLLPSPPLPNFKKLHFCTSKPNSGPTSAWQLTELVYWPALCELLTRTQTPYALAPLQLSKSAVTHKATKMALKQLNESLSQELAEAGLTSIAVHNLSPGARCWQFARNSMWGDGATREQGFRVEGSTGGSRQ